MVTIPSRGMGATLCVGSDRYPYTIIDVKTPKLIMIQVDNHDGDKFAPNTSGEVLRVSYRKKHDCWLVSGKRTFVRIGEREYYLDPSF